jgi:hypothetical protein
MLAVGGDLRKSKAVFGNGGLFLNRANFQEDGERSTFSVGRRPYRKRAAQCYFNGMNILLLIVILLLLFGGGGFYFGGPLIGGGGLGLILLICLVIYFAGGFRNSKS